MGIKDVARLAGTSPATVSRVLNDPSYRCADESARERVWQAAMELGYTPNEAARALRSKRPGDAAAPDAPLRVQVLMTRAGSASDNDPFFRELLHCVEVELAAAHCILADIAYRADFSSELSASRMDVPAQIRRMRAEACGEPATGEPAGGRESAAGEPAGGGGPAAGEPAAGEPASGVPVAGGPAVSEIGLIVVGKCDARVLEEAQAQYGCVVAVGRNPVECAVDEVVCDGRKMASLAVGHLRELGHTRIGYVGECRNESRYRGYQEALDEAGLELIPGWVRETRQTEDEGYEAMRAFLASDDAPTAIYCANDLTALGMLRCLAGMRHLRTRPSIIGGDDIESAAESNPALSTVRVPKREMAHLAVQLLVDRARGGHATAAHIELEGTLIQRATTEPL